jgi:hypothetical protein
VQEAVEPIGWLDANAELVGVPRRRLARRRADPTGSRPSRPSSMRRRVAKETANDMASWEADLDDEVAT